MKNIWKGVEKQRFGYKLKVLSFNLISWPRGQQIKAQKKLSFSLTPESFFTTINLDTFFNTAMSRNDILLNINHSENDKYVHFKIMSINFYCW